MIEPNSNLLLPVVPEKELTPGKISQNSHFAKINEIDDGRETDNPHILANRWKRDNVPITSDMLETLLPGQLVSDESLTLFESLSLSDFHATELPFTDVTREKLRDVIGSTEPTSSLKVGGIYCFADSATGDLLYIGSSKHLGARAPSYTQPYRQSFTKGAWGSYLRSNPTLKGVTLHVYVLPAVHGSLHVQLEQYWLLKFNPRFNDLLVAHANAGTFETYAQRLAKMKEKGHEVFMYNYYRDTLVHSFPSIREAARLLGVNHTGISKQLSKDRNAVGFYFSLVLLKSATVALRTIDVLRADVADSKRTPSKRG